jgi:hypothetical protein
VGPRAVLDAVAKRKIPSTRRESNPDRPARSPALYRLSYQGSFCDFYICVYFSNACNEGQGEVVSMLFFNREPRHEGEWGSGVLASRIL